MFTVVKVCVWINYEECVNVWEAKINLDNLDNNYKEASDDSKNVLGEKNNCFLFVQDWSVT